MHRRRDSAAIVTEHRRDRGALLTPRWHGDVLLCQGLAARPGIYEYRNADGTITRELVTAETLSRSVAGLARAPVTLDHPDVDVRADNHAELNVGDVDGDIEVQDDGYIRVKIAVRRKDAQDAVLNKTQRELSPGYVAKIDKTPGEHPEFGKYDAEQVERTYNHLAIVRDARGGSRVALRTDNAGVATATARLDEPAAGGSGKQQKLDHRGETRMNPRLREILISLGVDVRRVDSDDQAMDMLAAFARRRRDGIVAAQVANRYGRRNDGRGRRGRRGRRDEDPMAPPMDPSMMGMDAEDPSMMLPPGMTGDEGEETEGQPYTDADGNPVMGPDGQPMTVDEVIGGLQQENEAMRSQLAGQADEEGMEEMTELAEDEDVPPEEIESVKEDCRRDGTGALGFACRILEAKGYTNGQRVDARRVDAKEVFATIRTLLTEKRRRDGHGAPAGRATGRQVWQDARRTDARDNVIRFDSRGTAGAWLGQQASAYHARRNGGAR